MNLLGKKSNDEEFIDVYNDLKNFPTMQDVATETGYHKRTVRKKATKLREEGFKIIDRSQFNSIQEILDHPEDYPEFFDDEIRAENARLGKQKQKFQDQNRVQNKSFREYARIENAVEAYCKGIEDAIRDNNLSVHTTFHNAPSGDKIGIVHWSDFHLNERVDTPHNSYDWDIASKRLKKHVDSIRPIAKAYGITKLVVMFGGDMINSDRRLDELLTNAGNRSKASVLALDLLSQALLDLNEDFNVVCTSVIGNESRIPQDVGWCNEIASDNYDWAIFEMLKLRFEGSQGIQFVRPMEPTETVLEVNGQNVLLIHGNGSVKKNNIDQQIQQIKGRYLAQNIRIDMVIFGHIHSTYLSDGFARSGSLVGSNEYSAANLNLESRASQNLYVVHADGGFDGIKIDLQNTDGVRGYDINERLKTYHTRGISETKGNVTIQQVIT